MANPPGPSSLILALETSQREATVALLDTLGVVHEERLSPQKRHDDDLLPAIDRLFTRAGLHSADMRGGTVCVSIGPGGFTGLRIAVATAKMFAEALGVKLVAVPSALVAAEAFATHLAPGSARGSNSTCVLIAMACKGETFWATRVRRGAGAGTVGRETASDAADEWAIVGEPGIARAESFDMTGIRAVIADEYFPDAAAQRVRNAGLKIIAPVFSAQACLRVGERMLLRGETIDPLRLLPLYPRQPEAVTIWEKRQAP